MINYCINRDDRPERWEYAQKQFTSMDINVVRIPAKVTPMGWQGCRDSHLKCLVNICVNEEDGIIFEDDILFLHDKDSFWRAFNKCLSELPDNWDILYLGASPQEPMIPYSEHLYKIKRNFTTHAMLWNFKGRAIDAILMAEDRMEIGKWDVFLSEKIHPYFNAFVVKPMLCTQSSSFQSDTCTRSDTTTIIKNYNKYCNEH